MQNKMFKRIKLLIGFAIVGIIAWMFVIKPQLTFHSNEATLEKAAKRYFDLNSTQLPAGERVKTLSLQSLYDNGLIEKDFYVPLSTKTCSNENSWVKVKRENGEYKYYVYLECGYMKSKVDHEGPQIVLNGKEKITINKDSKYKELGVKSVVDNVDGNLKVSDVSIRGKVDTSQIDTYEITYTAYDKLNNKTTVKREVKVVRRLYNVVKNSLKEETHYKGNSDNNYLRLSNIIFRIYGYDENKNIIIVSDLDIANVNYTKIDEWLKYFYNNLNDKAKKMIVDNKFCSMTLDEAHLKTTECTNYTEKKKVYIPSVVEINSTKMDGSNFMQPSTMSWIAEKKDNKQAYVTRDYAYLAQDVGVDYFAYDASENYGVRPMMKIKGDSLVVSGDGTYDNPYSFADTKKAKGSDLLNTREVGEYVTDTNTVWRIVKIMEDGTTKVISDKIVSGTSKEMTCYPQNENGIYLYNPRNKESVGYCINNKGTKYYDTSNFKNQDIEVPIYKDNIIYKEESETKKYKAVLSAPDMYEMFSAAPKNRRSYWLINSSQKEFITGAITEIGVPVNGENKYYLRLYIRPVGYYKKDVIITSGKGTEQHPYRIK